MFVKTAYLVKWKFKALRITAVECNKPQFEVF